MAWAGKRQLDDNGHLSAIGNTLAKGMISSIQARAWSSPIWYTSEN